MAHEGNDSVSLTGVYEVIKARIGQGRPDRSYVARLVAAGQNTVLKKIAEECGEVLLAAKDGDRAAAIHELADLQFHLLVWMATAGITPKDIEAELGERFGRSGLERTDRT